MTTTAFTLAGYQVVKDLGSNAIFPLIGIKSKVDVGIYGVKSLFLKFIGFYFVHQTDSATLLLHINDRSFPLLFNHLHGLVKLFATFAAQ